MTGNNGHATTLSRLTDLRVPPQHIDSEKYIVAAAINFPEAREIVPSLVSPDQFYSDIHAGLLRLVGRLKDDGKLSNPDETVNFNSILTAIDDSGICNQITGGINSFVADLLYLPCQTYLRYHAGRIVSSAIQRTTINRLEEETRAAWDGESAEEITARMIATAESIREKLIFDRNDRWLTSKELDEAEYPREYLASGILAKGQFCIVGGPSKGCKTTFLADLGLGLSSGNKILNEFYVSRPVRVGIVSAESGPSTLQETARRIARSTLWPNLGDYENLFWKFDLPRLSEPGVLRRLIRWVESLQLEVLILDPFYLMAGLSENASNMFVVGPLLALLQTVGDTTGVTIIIAHHFKKLGPFDQYSPPELGMLAWSGFEQYARQWLLLNRREAYDAETGLHRLWLAAGGSAGHGGLFAVDAFEGRQSDPGGRCWRVTVSKASEARQQERQERDQRKEQEQAEKLERDIVKVLDTLERHPDGISKSLLRDESGVGGKIGAILPVILGDGRAKSCRFTAANGQEYDGFQIGTRTPGQTLGQHPVSDCPTDTIHITRTTPPYKGRVRPSGVCVGVTDPTDADEGNEILSECPDWESEA